MRVAVTGAAGRMGKTLIQAIEATEDLTLGAAFEHPDNPAVGQDAGEGAGVGTLGVAITSDPEQSVTEFDVVIDFTVPAATIALAQICARHGRGIIVGTTGFTEGQLSELQAVQDRCALFMAPNMSLGVNLAFKLIEIAARVLGDSVDVEVLEAHHRHKIDAPSGTAVRIGEILAEVLDRDLEHDAIYGREGITGARARNTIGFSTMRGGDIVGEHTVMFAGEGERIEITHRAHSRMNFATGALTAARYIGSQPPGLYNMQQLLDL